MRMLTFFTVSLVAAVAWAEDFKYVDRGVSQFTPIEREIAYEVVASSQPPLADEYLAMITADWCGYCISWKNTQMRKVQDAGVTVTEVDIKNYKGGDVSSLPTFILFDRKTKKELKRWKGVVSAKTIVMSTSVAGNQQPPAAEIEKPVAKSAPAAKSGPQRYVYRKEWGTIDLETYGGCSSSKCGMCREIRKLQSEYRRQKASAALPDAQQPTPDETITQSLDLMRLTANDTLADVGCGDGRVLIEAARSHGCKGVGIEIDAELAELARQQVAEAGMADRIEIITGDALDFNPSDYSVTAIFAHLYQPLLEKLSPKFQQVSVVASPFHQVPGLEGMVQHGDVWIYRR